MLRKVSSLVVIALSMILIGSAWAADTLWSVDIQGAGSSGFGQLDPPTLMEGVEPTYGFGNVWNAFNVAGHDLPALVDPSMQLVDSEGNATVVTFSITGNISGFSYNNTIPLVQDYLFVNAGNSDVSVSWSISGLKAGSTYELYTYGGGVVGRDVGLTVDEDGDGDLGNNQIQNIPTDGYLFTVKASASGSIMGEAGPGTAGEGNWSGFQLKGAYQTETSSGPSPENEATDVPRGVVLSWMPGEFAQAHNVYFGTSSADVDSASADNAMGVLVSLNQDANAFDPGALDFGQTYFWRVDEVNGTPDKTVFKGDVWSFTLEPHAIPVSGSSITATASSASNEFSTADKTIDGSGLGPNGQHDIAPDSMWYTAPVDLDPWIQYEFDRVLKLDIMRVWNSNSSAEVAIGWGVKDLEIVYSVDGTTWNVLEDANQFSRATGSPMYDQYDEIAFHGVAAKYVRLNIASNWGGILMSYSLSEVQFDMIPVYARTPEPASGSVDILPDDIVTWRAGRDSAEHTIYVGTDQNAVADGTAASIVSSTYSLDLSVMGLELGQTYYWRVDEVNESEAVAVWPGAVWNLSTRAALVVEDFEGYTNVSPNRPFQTWLDGFGYSADEFFPVAYGGNGTGAAIGHDIWSLSSPYYDGDLMETVSTIPGSGKSMPLYYTNTGGTASQTEREFAEAQDWTTGGVKTLSIAFRGQPGNTGSLFVKINDSTVLYERDPGNIALKQWQVWNIDLLSTGAALQAVTKLVIGVEGVGASGMLLIDDITLHPKAGELIVPTPPDNAGLVGHYTLDGNVSDSSGSGTHGTMMGVPVYEAGIHGQALRLNGIDDFVDMGVPENWPSGNAPRTLCAWGMTSSIEPGWRWLAAYGSPATGQAMFIGINGAGLFGGGYGDDVSVPDFWELDEWSHVALTYDGVTARLYANGMEVVSAVKTWDLVPSRAHIGRQVNDATEFWDGLVDDVRVYDEVLSAEEMAWLGGKTAPIDKPF